MARPRVFISSTYYDLKQTRENLDVFLHGLGYDTVRNEHGDIPYGNKEKLEKYCYKEVSNIDIFVSIIGGRFGTEAENSRYSISNEELRTAFNENKQVYIFIEKSVDNEYQTYLRNKGNATIKYSYVDDVKIYEFIEEVRGMSSNNNIKTFESSNEIQDYLKEQFAGLFQSFLDSNAKSKDIVLSQKLESLAVRFETLSNEFQSTKDNISSTLHVTHFVSHPVVLKISSILSLPYGIWFDDYDGLNALMNANGWQHDYKDGFYEWTHDTTISSTIDVIKVSESLFEENGELKFNIISEPIDELIIKDSISMPDSYDPNDLPF